LVSLTDDPGAAWCSVPLGYGEQFSATATYSDNSTQNITASAMGIFHTRRRSP